MKYKKTLFASIIMIVLGALLLVVVPNVLGTLAPRVDASEGADIGWWRTVWYAGLVLGYVAYALLIAGGLLMVITFLRGLFKRSKNLPQ